MGKDDARRLKRVVMDPIVLEFIFREGIQYYSGSREIVVDEGLPGDAKIIDIGIDNKYLSLDIVYESSEFENVDFGEEIPVIKPLITCTDTGSVSYVKYLERQLEIEKNKRSEADKLIEMATQSRLWDFSVVDQSVQHLVTDYLLKLEKEKLDYKQDEE